LHTRHPWPRRCRTRLPTRRTRDPAAPPAPPAAVRLCGSATRPADPLLLELVGLLAAGHRRGAPLVAGHARRRARPSAEHAAGAGRLAGVTVDSVSGQQLDAPPLGGSLQQSIPQLVGADAVVERRLQRVGLAVEHRTQERAPLIDERALPADDVPRLPPVPQEWVAGLGHEHVAEAAEALVLV